MEQWMAQGVWVQKPPMTVLGHDMAGDAKSARICFSWGYSTKGNKRERFIKTFSFLTLRVS